MGSALLLASTAFVLTACADSSDEEGLPPPDANADPNEIPTNADAMLPWLVAEPYLESGPRSRPSTHRPALTAATCGRG